MNKNEYKTLHKLESTYWWHVGKNEIINRLIKKYIFPNNTRGKILDLGCGTGSLISQLQQYGEVTGVDSSPEAIRYCRSHGINNLLLAKIETVRLPQNSFDLVTAFDLFEHVRFDEKMMKKVYTLLKPGGYVLLSVPAHKFLWSEHDEALSHVRRYSKKELREKVLRSGFYITRLTYSIFFFFLPIYLFRTFQTLFIKSSYPKTSYILLPDRINAFLIRLLIVEASLIGKINLPMGVSLVCLGKKPE